MRKAQEMAPVIERIVAFGDGGAESLETLAAAAPDSFLACDTAADDVCLIGFTSGTTGVPKGTMHFHRDMMAICDGYARHLLRARPDDRFIGSPPIAFTFGLGGLVLFPLRAHASTVLLEKASPADLLAGIETFRATVSFTAPTAYRAMIPMLQGRDISSLRICVSAGEALPKPTFEAWREATGLPITEGIGATEMLHIFIGSTPEDVRPGATGRLVPGYEARIVDDAMNDVPDGQPGRLAVRGPTGCRYLDDERQAVYVRDGWNITGDTYIRDADGYYWYQARNDDMIISAGYNIAGPEVEAALLTHAAVKECGVVGQPDPERGMIVKAYVILADGFSGDPALAAELQDHVKREIAPYKYPRSVEFVGELPRTDTGKLRRSVLRDRASGHIPG
jgi:2-aminobenzoate-CoA ligase